MGFFSKLFKRVKEDKEVKETAVDAVVTTVETAKENAKEMLREANPNSTLIDRLTK